MKFVTKRKLKNKGLEGKGSAKVLIRRKENLNTGENINFEIADNDSVLYGQPNLLDYALPQAIDCTRINHIYMDGIYMSTLMCVNFPYEVIGGWLEDVINAGDGIEVSLRQYPLSKAKVLRDVTQASGFAIHKMKTGGENQLDSEIQANSIHHSKIIKQALVEGDDLWKMTLLIRVSARSLDDLKSRIEKVSNILVSRDIAFTVLDCRQLEGFISTLPLGKFHNSFKSYAERNILTSGLSSTFPFTSYELSDTEGIFVGINRHNGSAVILDNFNTQKYSNANMVILGTSGSGKTFTTQLIASRLNLQRIPIMMICPLKGFEYQKLCENVGGKFVKFSAGSEETINIFDIRPNKNQESLLLSKLQRLQVFFSLLFPDIAYDEKQRLDNLVLKIYADKGITDNNQSLYQAVPDEGEECLSLKPLLKPMPTLGDLYDAVCNDSKLAHLANLLKPFVSGSMRFMNGQTSIDFNNSYIVADISDVQKDNISLIMFTVLDCFWEKIKENIMQKKCLILDEAWRLMGAGGNKLTAEFVLEVFKTIRGFGGAGIIATQDVEDFMALDGGKYGRGIINNAKLKVILQLEEAEVSSLQQILNLSEEEVAGIIRAARGKGLLYAGNNHVSIDFIPTDLEKALITTDRKELIKYWGDVSEQT